MIAEFRRIRTLLGEGERREGPPIAHELMTAPRIDDIGFRKMDLYKKLLRLTLPHTRDFILSMLCMAIVAASTASFGLSHEAGLR